MITRNHCWCPVGDADQQSIDKNIDCRPPVQERVKNKRESAHPPVPFSRPFFLFTLAGNNERITASYFGALANDARRSTTSNLTVQPGDGICKRRIRSFRVNCSLRFSGTSGRPISCVFLFGFYSLPTMFLFFFVFFCDCPLFRVFVNSMSAYRKSTYRTM